MPTSRYIPAVDGLRALAVFSVIAFHFGVPYFDGGFIGVDIFFVISGFVIFRSIAAEWSRTGAFSWRNFTLRRVRRLAPAAFVMVFVSGILALSILDPVDLRAFAFSALSHLFCASNIYFAETLGYFSGDSELIPLLHTWSLSVEEQFYLFVPIVVVLVTRVSAIQRQKLLLKALWIAGGCSFVACLIVCNNSPTHGFFLAPTRAWEFCAGAILALSPFGKVGSQLKWNGGIGYVGTFMILISVVFMEEVKYPRAHALVPVLGTVFLIASLISSSSTFLTKAFSMPAVAWLGRLSYSLYLWHWPFISFREHILVDSPLWLDFSLFGLGFGFAVGSYYLVERPFRFRLTAKASLRVILALWSISLLGSLAIVFGIVVREASPAELAHRKDVDWYGEEFRGRDVPIGSEGETVDFVIWGDSHAGMITDVVDRLGREYGLTGRAFVSDTTLPIPGTEQAFPDRYSFNNDALTAVRAYRPRFLLLVSSWAAYLDDGAKIEVARRNLGEMAESLRSEGTEVIFLRRVPRGKLESNARSVLVMKRFPALNEVDQWGVTLSDYEETRPEESSLLAGIEENLSVIDPRKVFFENDARRVLLYEETAFYRDMGHLSFSGAERYILPLLEPVFRGIRGEE